MKISVIVPVSSPGRKTEEYIKDLIKNGMDDIIIVSGSGLSSNASLAVLEGLSQITLVRTGSVSRGAALKEAFGFLSRERPEADGAIICEEDGRYPYEAIKACMDAFAEDQQSIIAGKRSDEKTEGAKNKLDCFLYRFAMGIKIKDSSCSLRLIPAYCFKEFSKPGKKTAGYETRMLIWASDQKIPYTETEIKEDPGAALAERISFKESFITYSIVLAYFIKFAISSVSSYLIDMGVYAILLYFLESRLNTGSQVFICTAVSRIISSLFNYTLNRRTVFKATDNLALTTVKYYIIAVLKLAASYILIWLFTDLLKAAGFIQLIIKALVDIVLFIFSFELQRGWVFKNKRA